MFPSQQHKRRQPFPAGLTRIHTTLLSDRDATPVASILEQVHHLLPEAESSEAAADPGTIELQVGACLDRGIQRKDRPNEDSLLVTQGVLQAGTLPPTPFALCLVADGMGGHDHGQEAGQLALQTFVEFLYPSLFSRLLTPETILTRLREGVQFANHHLYQRNQREHTMMGTTMTVALISGTTAYIANVGDSRTYLAHPASRLIQVTQDHSLVAALVQAGVLKRDDIYIHPMRNQIYRSLGEKPEIEVDTFVVSLTDGDLLLLCSDGLWEMVRDWQIQAILTDATESAQQRADALTQAALAAGGVDNVSVIVTHVKQEASQRAWEER